MKQICHVSLLRSEICEPKGYRLTTFSLEAVSGRLEGILLKNLAIMQLFKSNSLLL